MTSSRILLDTNVLVYAMHPSDERHDACLAVLERTRDPKSTYCVTPQVLGEFYRVVTDARKVAEPRTPDEALAALDVLEPPAAASAAEREPK